MSSSIPYDHPSLVLGNIVNKKVLKGLNIVSSLQKEIDAAQDKLNSNITLKRSFEMTKSELISLGVIKKETKEITEGIKEVDKNILEASQNYLKVRIKNEKEILNARTEISKLKVGDEIESPLDYGVVKLKGLPLSSESLKLDAQYFSHENNDSVAGEIKNYVEESMDMTSENSRKLGDKVSKLVHQQQKNHRLSGTLVITANCTHKNIGVIEPFKIDIEKAIDVWNAHQTKKLKREPRSMKQIAISENDSDQDEGITIISGAAYGSSFVGMVHIVKNERIATNPSNEELNRLQERIKLSGWVQYQSGGVGVDSSVVEDIKRMLSSYEVSSHISLIVMGATPSIKSNNLSSNLKEISGFDSAKRKPHSEINKHSIKSDADEAKNQNLNAHIEHKRTAGLLNTLGAMDNQTNKVMDINSLMLAFENYLNAILPKEGKVIGTPIHFYLKKITAPQIAGLWLNKYFPEEEKEKKNEE